MRAIEQVEPVEVVCTALAAGLHLPDAAGHVIEQPPVGAMLVPEETVAVLHREARVDTRPRLAHRLRGGRRVRGTCDQRPV